MKKEAVWMILIISISLFIGGCDIYSGTNPDDIYNFTTSDLVYSEREIESFEEYYDRMTRIYYSPKYYSFDYAIGADVRLSPEINELELIPGYDDDGYLDYCESKYTDINFTNYFEPKYRFNYENYEFSYIIRLFNDLYEFSSKLKNQDCYYGDNYYESRYFDDPYNNNFVDFISRDFIKLRDAGYSDHEILEIATIFVQAIPYDLGDDWSNKYPYETLYEENGNCLDKTVILINIAKNLGFETYLIFGDSENLPHALMGIACEEGNFEYNSKQICFVETTQFTPIGSEGELTNQEYHKFSDGKTYYENKYGVDLANNLENKYLEIDEIGLELDRIYEKLGEIDEDLAKITRIFDWQYSQFYVNQYNDLIYEYNSWVNDYSILLEQYYFKIYESQLLMFNNFEMIEG
ncbi:MAG: hypothetical protein ABIH25_01320 [Candidatus Woesearchaeota archaeon]